MPPPDPLPGELTIDAFSVIAFDVPTSTLLKFSEAGVLVDMLPVTDTIGIQPVVGLAIVDHDYQVRILGANGIVASVDLLTGDLTLLWDVGRPGFEAMGGSSWYMASQVVLGNYLDNEVLVFDFYGNKIRTVPLATSVGIIGIDLHYDFVHVASEATGNIHIYDAYTGAETAVQVTGLPPGSLSAIGVDPDLVDWTPRNWVATGFGSDELVKYDVFGNLVLQVPSGFTWINALDIGDGHIVPVELQSFTVE